MSLSQMCDCQPYGVSSNCVMMSSEQHMHQLYCDESRCKLGFTPGALRDAVDLAVVELGDQAAGVVVDARLRPFLAALVQQLPQRQPHLQPGKRDVRAILDASESTQLRRYAHRMVKCA